MPSGNSPAETGIEISDDSPLFLFLASSLPNQRNLRGIWIYLCLWRYLYLFIHLSGQIIAQNPRTNQSRFRNYFVIWCNLPRFGCPASKKKMIQYIGSWLATDPFQVVYISMSISIHIYISMFKCLTVYSFFQVIFSFLDQIGNERFRHIYICWQNICIFFEKPTVREGKIGSHPLGMKISWSSKANLPMTLPVDVCFVGFFQGADERGAIGGLPGPDAVSRQFWRWPEVQGHRQTSERKESGNSPPKMVEKNSA